MCDITFEIALSFTNAIATKFFKCGFSEYKCNHCFGYNSSSRYRANIRTLINCFGSFASLYIDICATNADL